MTDAPLPEDPRDALIREQAGRLAAQDRQLAQAAVRPLKTQQKISGRLTSDDVTQDRLGKHGHNAMDVLHQLMLGVPWRPPPQAFSP